jgi:putative hydrolases of HD superfamily
MKTKNINPYELIRGENLGIILEIYFQINHLKQLYRQGWLMRHISEEKCESVAEHSFGVALLALLINDAYGLNFDVLKIVVMSLTHELGEIENGDFTPFHNISKDEKHDRERASIVKLLAGFPGGEKYVAVWDEFEEEKTSEARFVRQLDKLEMGIQSFIYENFYQKDLKEFRIDAMNRLSDNFLKNILQQL